MTEQDKSAPLSLEEQEKLRPLQQRLAGETSVRARSAVMISEEVINGFKRLLNMGDGQKVNSPEEGPYRRASEIAVEYLQCFAKDESTTGTCCMYYQVKDWVEKNFLSRLEYNQGAQDAATIGIFLVLKVFEMQLGKGFIGDLKSVGAREVINAFNKVRTELTSSSSLIERARNKIGIPEYQFYLGEFIEKFTGDHSGDFGPQVKTGAILGLGVIDELWSKLKPGTPKDATK